MCLNVFFFVFVFFNLATGFRQRSSTANFKRCFKLPSICSQALSYSRLSSICVILITEHDSNNSLRPGVFWNGKQLTPQRMLQLAHDLSGEINIWIYSSVLCDSSGILVVHRCRLSPIRPHGHRLGSLIISRTLLVVS